MGKMCPMIQTGHSLSESFAHQSCLFFFFTQVGGLKIWDPNRIMGFL